jgi:hypothetical protein
VLSPRLALWWVGRIRRPPVSLFDVRTKFMKNVIYFIFVLAFVFITILLFRNCENENVTTVNQQDFIVDSNSIFTFTNDGFKCFLPNKPTIQELSSGLVNGKHIFAFDSTDFFLYSINITYNSAGENITEYGDNETFLTTYFDTYLKTAPLLVNPRIITISNINFKSKYDGMEYQIISDEFDAPLYQYGIFFIKNKHIFKVAINFPRRSKHLAKRKYNPLISSFNFLGQK